MSHWFPSDRRFAFVPLAELADEVNTASPRLLLPTFQRDAVWDEKHVELLWDSLLRDFRFGALLVARPPERASTRQLQLGRGAAAKPSQADAADLVLVDGQQRAIAVALGFRQWSPGDPVRLWIDMANGEEGGAFALRLCTLRYPWGRAARDHHKRAALERLGASALPADEGEWLGQSWPADLTAPVPVAELLASVRPSEAWRALVPKALGSADIPQAQAGHVERVLRALERLRAYELPAVLLEGVESLDDLGKVFERLDRIGHLDFRRELAREELADRVLNLGADDETQVGESGLERIVDRIVDYCSSAGAHRVNLLDAPVSASHPRGEKDECCSVVLRHAYSRKQ